MGKGSSGCRNTLSEGWNVAYLEDIEDRHVVDQLSISCGYKASSRMAKQFEAKLNLDPNVDR